MPKSFASTRCERTVAGEQFSAQFVSRPSLIYGGKLYGSRRPLLLKADQSYRTVTLLFGMANRHDQFSFVVENCVRQPLIWIEVESRLLVKDDEALREMTAWRAQADNEFRLARRFRCTQLIGVVEP